MEPYLLILKTVLILVQVEHTYKWGIFVWNVTKIVKLVVHCQPRTALLAWTGIVFWELNAFLSVHQDTTNRMKSVMFANQHVSNAMNSNVWIVTVEIIFKREPVYNWVITWILMISYHSVIWIVKVVRMKVLVPALDVTNLGETNRRML